MTFKIGHRRDKLRRVVVVQSHDSSATANRHNITLLDGAIGTELLLRGMPLGVSMELWCRDHPDVLLALYQEYIEAGAQALRTATGSAGPVGLARFGLASHYEQINADLVQIARRAVGAHNTIQLGGSISATGQAGESHLVDFDQLVEQYAQHAAALASAGVDYIVLENQRGLSEVRAALLGVQQACDLPVHITLNFAAGRTLSGDAPASCAITLEALGAAAVGVNGGAGLDADVRVVEEMSRFVHVPVIAKPSAGKARMIDGRSVYAILDDELAEAALRYAQAGARRIGGCCGATPRSIAKMKQTLQSLSFFPRPVSEEVMLCSRRRQLPLTHLLMIGNLRANAYPAFLNEIRDINYRVVVDAIAQMGQVQLLCIHAAAEGLDEERALLGMGRMAWKHSDLPMAFRPAQPAALAAVLREYPGRALVILDCAQPADRAQMQRIAERYGAVCML